MKASALSRPSGCCSAFLRKKGRTRVNGVASPFPHDVRPAVCRASTQRRRLAHLDELSRPSRAGLRALNLQRRFSRTRCATPIKYASSEKQNTTACFAQFGSTSGLCPKDGRNDPSASVGLCADTCRRRIDVRSDKPHGKIVTFDQLLTRTSLYSRDTHGRRRSARTRSNSGSDPRA